MKTYRRLLVLLFATTLAFSPITRAAAIVLLRDQMGGFTSVDQLLNVSGIGAATLERIRPLIVLE